MSPKSPTPNPKTPAARVVRDVRRATRKHHPSKDNIRIVLEGSRGEESIAALCRREGIAESLHRTWSKEFLKAGKRAWLGTRPGRPQRTRSRRLARRPSR
jgi:transposase